ncbi:cation channel sperm-associated protein subunit delta isoform X3 [Prionailurus iriomotensis]
MLVAAATLRLCLVAGARQLDRLYFSSGTPRLIKHPCKKNIALYLGETI